MDVRNLSERQAGTEMERCCGLVEMAFEQVAASLKRVCLLQALTGRQLGQTLEQRWPGDDLTAAVPTQPELRMSGLAAAHGATGPLAPLATQTGGASTHPRFTVHGPRSTADRAGQLSTALACRPHLPAALLPEPWLRAASLAAAADWLIPSRRCRQHRGAVKVLPPALAARLGIRTSRGGERTATLP